MALAESKGIDLSQISLKELQSVNEIFDEEALKVLDLHNSKEARKSFGGTANKSVLAQIEFIDEFLKNSEI